MLQSAPEMGNQSYLSIPKFVLKHNILGKKTGGFKSWIISAADAGIYRLKKYDRVHFFVLKIHEKRQKCINL